MKRPSRKISNAYVGELRGMQDRGEIRPPGKDAPVRDMPPEFWENAVPLRPASGKKLVSIRIDEDVLNSFKKETGGKGYLTRMNAVLRAYVDAQQHVRSQRGRRRS